MPEVLTETDVSPCPACGMVDCFDHQLRVQVDAASKIVAERSLLERDVVTTAKAFHLQRGEREWELIDLESATHALIEFESSQQQTKK